MKCHTSEGEFGNGEKAIVIKDGSSFKGVTCTIRDPRRQAVGGRIEVVMDLDGVVKSYFANELKRIDQDDTELDGLEHDKDPQEHSEHSVAVEASRDDESDEQQR